MSLFVRPLLRESWGRLRQFAAATEPSSSFFAFTAVFFVIWSSYDLLDLLWGGTAANYWLVAGAAETTRDLRILQIALLASELAIVGVTLKKCGPRGLLFALLCLACALRTVEAIFYFGLNDFYYYALTVFLLIQFFALDNEPRLARWPREFLRYQTAWIYFATGFLKLNPHWLSGDHLWIRQAYLIQILHWPEPHWFQNWVSLLPVEQGLAIAGAAGELSLAVLLALRAPRWLVVSMAICMHGFAALALNVWFFGASMVAQVAFVSKAPAHEKGS